MSDSLDGAVEQSPEVVCLCGSTRFKDEYRAENRRLTMDGKIVVSVGFFGHADDIEFSEDEKSMLDELHKRKIDIADRIHVINVDGYIGDSTESEIKYARDTGTEVTYLEGPDRCPDCAMPECVGSPDDESRPVKDPSGDVLRMCDSCLDDGWRETVEVLT